MRRVAELQEYFFYDSKTGIFRWKKHRCRHLVGKVAGCKSRPNDPYWILTLHDKKLLAHKVAWAIYYGRWPRFDLDHRDLDKLNNGIINLRRSNKSKNGANRSKQKNNTSGYKGVFWMKKAKCWLVQIRARNKLHYVGIYKQKCLAAAAYKQAAVRLHGEFARAA